MTFVPAPEAKHVVGPYSDILKDWARGSRKVIGGFAAVSFAGISTWGIVAGFKEPPTPFKFCFAAWTIAVPTWFFLEAVYGVDFTKQVEDFEIKFTRFKAAQEAARGVWAGCAAAIAVLLLKGF